MRTLVAAIALTCGASFATAPATAQSSVPRDCRDDRGQDRCAAEKHRQVLALYGMQPIEDHARAGDQVRRVFYVDGYGRDMVAVSFVRAPGRDPLLKGHFPRREGVAATAPAEALVPAATWQEVLERSAYFDRALAPAASTSSGDAVSICLHGWVYTVEAVDPALATGGQPVVRRKVENACGDGLAQPYATAVADLALPLLPYCASLDPNQHRGAAGMLRACGLLAGDRTAAARAFTEAQKLQDTNDPAGRAEAQRVFGYRAVLDWSGQALGGASGQAGAAWAERTGGAQRANFYLDRAIGERVDRVRVEGFLARQVEEGGQSRSLRAPVTLIFTASPSHGGNFAIERATVGAFAPAG